MSQRSSKRSETRQRLLRSPLLFYLLTALPLLLGLFPVILVTPHVSAFPTVSVRSDTSLLSTSLKPSLSLSSALIVRSRRSRSTLSFINSSNNNINNDNDNLDEIRTTKDTIITNHQQQRQQQDEQYFLQRRRTFMNKNLHTVLTAATTIALAEIHPAVASAAAVAKVGPTVGFRRKQGGLAQRIRRLTFVMDELQRDLMTERYDLLPAYIPQLKSYVPLLTTFTDAAFPPSQYKDSEYNVVSTRIELKNEISRFIKSTDRLRRDVKLFESNPSFSVVDEAYTAYAAMSYHLDQYLRLAGLYTYYESLSDKNNDGGGVYYYGRTTSSLKIYSGNNSNPKKDPVKVGDLIVLFKGPDSGRTGILIGFQPKRDTTNCVVKLDEYKGIREIRSVPRLWAARRTGKQPDDAVFAIPRT